MKKFFVTAALAVAAIAANAQVYVGGDFNLWRNTEHKANSTSFVVKPEIGYILDEQSQIGVGVGYIHTYDGNSAHNGSVQTNSFVIAPYYRYTFLNLKNVDLFVEAGFGLATGKVKETSSLAGKEVSVESDAANSYEFGVKPGVSVNLSNKVSFVAKAGFFGYRTTNDVAGKDNAFGSNGFGVGLSSNDLSFGFVYKF